MLVYCVYVTKKQIIKDYKNKLITFDEAKLKIKQIQDNEKKKIILVIYLK